MNIVRDSLNAIRAALRTAFPTNIIYVNDVPQDFVRPSFYVSLIGAPTGAMAACLRFARPTWQVVYFPALLNTPTLSVDMFNLYDMHDKLLTLFAEPLFLRTQSGKILDIESFDGGPRNDAGYYTLRLDAQHWVARATPAPVQYVDINLNTKRSE